MVFELLFDELLLLLELLFGWRDSSDHFGSVYKGIENSFSETQISVAYKGPVFCLLFIFVLFGEQVSVSESLESLRKFSR